MHEHDNGIAFQGTAERRSLEIGKASIGFDDDGVEKRTGTFWTASAHIITAVIGSGVLSLAWGMAQLGWIAGAFVLLLFSGITYYTSCLLADCYRSPDPVHGKRNYTYTDAVKANLDERRTKLCGIAQYIYLFATCLGYTLTAAISMAAIERSNCFHKHGHDAHCPPKTNRFLIIFGCIQLFLSQIPNLHKLSWLSVIAAVMSFTYSTIGVGLSIARVSSKGASHNTSLTGVAVGVDVTSTEKIWKVCQALGDVAFAYAFTSILIEIQNTLKSSPPENKVMKKASFLGILVTTMYYMLCGFIGYAAFGNKAPGNFLTGFGFYEPFWLIDLANVCIAIHLFGSYQVFGQPMFAYLERGCSRRWPSSSFVNNELRTKILGFPFQFNMLRLVARSLTVIIMTIITMIFPFFNDVVGLAGSMSFWPLAVYFPTEMYIRKRNLNKGSSEWWWLRLLSLLCLFVSIAAAVGSVQGLITSLRSYKLFKFE
ncbi:hypothetical protein AMTRI_Chr13g90140 [Amborella trichopoda]|uniref:Amino acid transporter transmembrane domain-containing protein n=1 Tax=Amborella trichopoda TaxID=13333 RepID=U5CVR8_AMBTC|nr:amino acid permease 8 [Amborella trichopoda]ERN14214.1 hypothetical protein AMTR_s00033p00113090 [Amborella trichopoda]|eukprot:XP_006852747.1 amino acid permease 8 [Amborella trichopoda]